MLYRCLMRTYRPASLSRLAVAGLVLFGSVLLAACADSGSASDAIITQQPLVTSTPVTLGGPAATVTPLPAIQTLTPSQTLTPATPTPVTVPTVAAAVLADTAFTNGSKVTTVGLDEVFFGMAPDAAAASASTTWAGMPATAAWPNCFVITPSNGPDGVSFWVFNRTVERVNISHPAIRTRSGYGVGTQLSDLQQALGSQLEVTDFGDGSQTAVFVPSDPTDAGFRLIFEVRDGEVFRFRSGRVGVVELPDTSCP